MQAADDLPIPLLARQLTLKSATRTYLRIQFLWSAGLKSASNESTLGRKQCGPKFGFLLYEYSYAKLTGYAEREGTQEWPLQQRQA